MIGSALCPFNKVDIGIWMSGLPLWFTTISVGCNRKDNQKRALPIIYPELSYQDALDMLDLKTLYVGRGDLYVINSSFQF